MKTLLVGLALLTAPAETQADLWSEATSIDLLNANYPYIEHRFGPAKSGEVRKNSGDLTYMIGRCQIDVVIIQNRVSSYSFDVKPGCETVLGGNWAIGRVRIRPGLTFADVKRALSDDDSGQYYGSCIGNCAQILGNSADPSFGFRYDSPRAGISIELETDYHQGSSISEKWEAAIRRQYGLTIDTSLPIVTYECPTPLNAQVAQWFAAATVTHVTVSQGEKPLGHGKCSSFIAEVAKAKREGRDYTVFD